MSLVISEKPLLFNYDPVEITVEFLVIHYTCVSFSKTLDLFQNPKTKASSHFVVDQDGSAYELVSCLQGKCFRAWHAGESYLQEGKKEWRQFNDFSIGVELVNRNGNLFEYTKKQYRSLQMILEKLKVHYPALKNPKRVIGHEHIAGYRGKVDPGHCFNWPVFFEMSYSGAPLPLRPAVLPKEKRKFFSRKAMNLRKTEEWTDEDWIQLNRQMEHSLKKFKASGLKKNSWV